MELHVWQSYVLINELPNNGVFACTITDSVLDMDAWPIWSITMRDGVVIGQIGLYNGLYGIENMVEWDKKQLAEWVQFQSIQPEQQENCIMLLG